MPVVGTRFEQTGVLVGGDMLNLSQARERRTTIAMYGGYVLPSIKRQDGLPCRAQMSLQKVYHTTASPRQPFMRLYSPPTCLVAVRRRRDHLAPWRTTHREGDGSQARCSRLPPRARLASSGSDLDLHPVGQSKKCERRQTTAPTPSQSLSWPRSSLTGFRVSSRCFRDPA